MRDALSDFRETLVYERTGTLAGWRADLEELRRIDSRAEALRRRWIAINVVVGVVLAIAALIALVIGDRLPRPALGMLLGVPATLMVIGIIRMSSVKRHDVENRRYELVEGILGLLAHDMPRDGQVSIRLDLLPAGHDRKFQRRAELGGWNVKFYEDPWLELRGRLRDGTKFALTMREHLQLRRRWKRGSSGKSKLKTKKKSSLSATLRLKVDLEEYPGLEMARVGGMNLKLPAGVQAKGPEIKGETLLLHASTKQPWSAGTAPSTQPTLDGRDFVATMFLGLYQLLGTARAGRKAS